MKNMGDSRRVARVEREVQQVVAKFLISGFKTTLPGLVTISKVVMPADLRTGKVYVSVLGGDGEQDRAVKLLNERAFEVQKYIGVQLKMRFCPKLTFFPDDITEKVIKIDRIFQEIEQEKNKRQLSEKSDSGEAELEDNQNESTD